MSNIIPFPPGNEKKRQIFLSLLPQNITEAEILEKIDARIAEWKKIFNTDHLNESPLLVIFAYNMISAMAEVEPEGRIQFLKGLYSTMYLDFYNDEVITSFYKKLEKAIMLEFEKGNIDHSAIISHCIKASLLSREEIEGLLGLS